MNIALCQNSTELALVLKEDDPGIYISQRICGQNSSFDLNFLV